MTYLTPANFRQDSLAEPCQGLALTSDDIDDAMLTKTIARLSARIDEWTYDHFEPAAAATQYETGEGMSRLYLSRRCRAVTTVKVYLADGTLSSAVAAGAYRLRSSLDAAGTVRVGELDWIELLADGGGLPGSNPWGWPMAVNTIQIVGNFDWASCPADIQQALAMMVWDRVKEVRPNLRAAQSVQTDTFVTRFVIPDPAAGIFTGMPECDEILGSYRRSPKVLIR